MKCLIFYCHPNSKSFNHAILEVVTGVLGKSHEVRIRDLYALGFNPVLAAGDFETFQKGRVPTDLREEQNHIRWADWIIVIAPIWWAGLPAVLKGFIDRVFSHGFAYTFGPQGVQGLLTGKKVLMISTTGTPREPYEQTGMFRSLNQAMHQGIFEFCGMTVVRHLYLSAVVTCPQEERVKMLGEVETVVSQI